MQLGVCKNCGWICLFTPFLLPLRHVKIVVVTSLLIQMLVKLCRTGAELGHDGLLVEFVHL